MNEIKTYDQLILLNTFEERYEYVLGDQNLIGELTFGVLRYLNQEFYLSKLWKNTRRDIILRDKGRDLAMPGYEINGIIYVHHLNALTPYDIIHQTDKLLDPKYLISTSEITHKGLHYSKTLNIKNRFVERRPNDTIPWR